MNQRKSLYRTARDFTCRFLPQHLQARLQAHCQAERFSGYRTNHWLSDIKSLTLRYKKLPGFTFAEIIIATGLAALLIGLVASGILWVRNGVRLVTSLDQDANLLHLEMVLHPDLDNAKAFLHPGFSENQDREKEDSKLVFLDSSRDINMIFVTQDERLVQYSHARKQFRDLLAGVKDFKVIRKDKSSIEYIISRQISGEMEAFRGAFSAKRQ